MPLLHCCTYVLLLYEATLATVTLWEAKNLLLAPLIMTRPTEDTKTRDNGNDSGRARHKPCVKSRVPGASIPEATPDTADTPDLVELKHV
jgi:hypothetical protein